MLYLVQFEFVEANIAIDNEVSLLAWWNSNGCLNGDIDTCTGQM